MNKKCCTLTGCCLKIQTSSMFFVDYITGNGKDLARTLAYFFRRKKRTKNPVLEFPGYPFSIIIHGNHNFLPLQPA